MKCAQYASRTVSASGIKCENFNSSVHSFNSGLANVEKKKIFIPSTLCDVLGGAASMLSFLFRFCAKVFYVRWVSITGGRKAGLYFQPKNFRCFPSEVQVSKPVEV